jgi:peroxiredoxin
MLLMIILFVSLFASAALSEEYGFASDFTLQDTNREMITLGTYRDKQAVLLLFWTTWCPYCREELKVLNNMHSKLIRDGLEVLAIDGGESFAKVNRFINVYGLTYRVLLDQDLAVAKSFGVLGIPTYVLINQKGYIVFKDNYFPREYKSLISE